MSPNAEKNNQETKCLDGEDLISNLPEAILSHILNLLPTKDAVRTGVLAKSWKNKWRLITSIELRDFLTNLDKKENEIVRAHSFIVFVNKVLNQISSSTIQKFGLHLQKRMYDPKDLFVLFSEVLKRGVQELNIDYHYDIPAFPTSVFRVRSLIKLVLDMDYCTIRVQSIVCLPNLQTLLLGGIQLLVVDDIVPRSKELVLNFPVLTSFEAYRCDWSNVKCISMNAPILDTFTLNYSCFTYEDLDDEPEPFAIKIDALYLREFSYQFISNQDILFSNASYIQEAHIGLSMRNELEEEHEEISVKMGKLLKAVNGVEYLKLGFHQFRVLRDLGLLNRVNDYLTTLSTFEWLRELEISLPRCLASQKVLLNFIHKSPILEILALNYSMTEFDSNTLLLEEDVPHCFLHTLEFAEFTVAEADVFIINLAKYVLQHSRVLKLINICLTSLKERYVIENINRVLLSSPRASNTVTIEVNSTYL